jgi:predicted DCC family thiol-disulfide oxidoreductase YuxK
VNIADPDFAAGEYGKTMSELMAQIHGRLPDGSWITGVEVFRRLYSAVGFSWLVTVTRFPIVSPLLDAAYRQFAKRRLNWTGRCRTGSEACRST